jgi:hypothetical protein
MAVESISGTVSAPALPLTLAEQDALLVASAGLERPSRVRMGSRLPGVNPRAWSRSGNVD